MPSVQAYQSLYAELETPVHYERSPELDWLQNAWKTVVSRPVFSSLRTLTHIYRNCFCLTVITQHIVISNIFDVVHVKVVALHLVKQSDIGYLPAFEECHFRRVVAELKFLE